MNLWNPHFPMAELSGLNESLKHHLRIDGFHTVEKLEHCTKEQLQNLGYDKKQASQVRAALKKHKNFVTTIEAIFAAEGLTAKQVKSLWPFDLLGLSFTCTQLGYILRWQKDVAGRYAAKEMFCVVNGRVYYCTNCPYRDERSNFCGVCYRKLLDDVAARKRG